VDPIICCALGICCPPGRQHEALAELLGTQAGLDVAQSDKVAAWLIATFDLAPAGSLRELKAAIADGLRKHQTKD
jgi:hypothetical protein